VWLYLEHHPWRCRLVLAVWCGLLFFHGLNIGQLWKTEGLRAIVAAEMLRSGNWIVPKLYGEPLFTKPPGTYVAIVLFSLPFGEVTEVTSRLPSAVAALLTVLLLYGYFARCFGRLGGLLVAITAPMSWLWMDKATAAEIDMMQVMWVTGALLCFLRALEATEDRESIHRFARTDKSRNPDLQSSTFPWWLAALLCVAGGVLTKWTAPAFFYATVVPLLWWRGRLRLLFRWQHLVAAVLGACVCLAWIGAAVAQEGWDVFYATVSREAGQRMLPSYAPRTDPWYMSVLHPLRIWGVNLPWSLVALLACRSGFGRLWDRRGQRLWQALHCWIWPNLLIWSLMLDHKARHSFPLFPAIGGLAAMVWLAWLTDKLRWPLAWQPRKILATTMLCWLAARLVFLHAVVPHQRAARDPHGKAAVLAALVPEGAVLYLFRIKDECIMFYFGRPVIRLAHPGELPSSPEPLYCILTKAELQSCCSSASMRIVVPLTNGLTDEQGDEIVLVQVLPQR
jgi:4-amino-4-deoxy-L-arabinose transferase-like glycosyltransferase